ncbi:MAG: xanthine dehydrogenase family protein subunit M, partial [Chloroflexi bacterium]|nr:xanthine dehydrogenase family protein subunit M [Chloroflexota bacterium]
AIVNIKRIPDLRGLTFNSHLTMGALTTLEEIKQSPIIHQHYPALASAAATMASVQIRNLATVGGNMCNAAPSADLAPILIALNAVAVINGVKGERRVALEEFFTGPGKSVLGVGELLVSVEVPKQEGKSIYIKHSPREHMDIAVVGVGVAYRGFNPLAQQAADVRIVLGAVAPTPLRAKKAEEEVMSGSLTKERIERAAKIAAEESKPIDDVRGSVWYRKKMVEVLVRRGLLGLVNSN